MVDVTHQLRPYQQTALDWLVDCGGTGYVAAKPGAGKTSIGLHLAAWWRLDRYEKSPVWVVAPKRVVQQWPQEARKWPFLAFLDVFCIGGPPKVRNASTGLISKADVVVVSFEFLEELLGHVKAKAIPMPGLLVWDEASRLRNGGRQGSKSWKMANSLSKAGVKCCLLSGSPRPGDAEELYAPTFLLDRGAALGKSLTEFRSRFMEPDQVNRRTGQVWSWKLRPGAQAELYGAIRHLYHAISPDLGLKSVVIDRFVTLPPKAMSAYKEMEKDQIVELGEDMAVAVSAGTLAGKLWQMASGTVYSDEGKTLELHDEKLQELDELLEELEGERVLVVAWFKSDFQRMQKRYGSRFRRLDSDADFIDAKAGRVTVMGLSPASAAHGIDGLQDVCSAVVWFAPVWSFELYDQTNRRIVRSGQKETVRIYRIIARGTIDERIVGEVLPTKESEQEEFFEALESCQ